MTSLVLAHVGHWTSVIPFFGPALILPFGLYAVMLLERRNGLTEDDDHDPQTLTAPVSPAPQDVIA
jgi:hypothetical protein